MDKENNMPKNKKLVLIDGNALVHRAFHALPPLSTKKGELVNAVYGFTATLLKVLSQIKPDYIAATFDSPGPTFRHKEFAEYKATRVAAPSELYNQIPRAKEVVETFSIPVFEKEGFEADDLIGALNKKAIDEDLEVIIVTGDLDTLQLVSPKTKVFTLKRGITDTMIYDEEAVQNRYNLKPSQLPDFKGLRGDPSDNIPGEKKDSKAVKLISPRTTEILLAQKEQALFSKKLATIISDIPLKFNLEDCLLSDYDKNQVFKLFQELGFKSLLGRLPEVKHKSSAKSSQEIEPNSSLLKHTGTHYEIITQEGDFLDLVSELKKAPGFCIDTEATSQEAMKADLVGISFALKKKEAFYVPIGPDILIKNQKTNIKNLEINFVLRELKPILEDPKIKKYGHNIKYDLIVLENHGISLSGIEFDSMIASYLLHPETRVHDLDSVAFSELGVQMLPITTLIGTGKTQIPIESVAIEKLGIYSCEDADITLRLVNHFRPHLQEEGLLDLFSKIEMPLVPVLAEMERAGVKIDIDFLNKLSSELEAKIADLTRKIYDSVCYEFNINSTQQLSQVLFEVLKISKAEVKKTKTGISTAASELDKLKGTHPVIDFVSQYRELTKLKTTYVDALPLLSNSKTGRVHTNFNQTITATGRLSSSDPNLQNIPIRGDYGEQIRKAFTAERGYKLLGADYSQIELRIITSLANDERMMEAFHSNEDIHVRTAAEVYGIGIDEVTSELRRAAKAINFGIIYGMSAHGLSQALRISHEEAADYIEKYFNLHAGIKNYITETIKKTREQGYGETLFGRRRKIPEINSSIFNVRAAAERMAINMPIQGTAADLIKLAMIEINDKLKTISDKGKMILQVHDELVFEVPESDVKKVAGLVKDIMENIYKLEVPIKVDILCGDNWGELEKLKIKS